MTFLLYETDLGVSTRCIYRFKKIMDSSKKKLRNYKFASLVNDTGGLYKTMVFKEENAV
jgi:hypothetical protein